VFHADRDTNFNPNDDAQLNSRGGVAILISPEITAIPVMSFSNGNCEIVAIECPELSIIIANIYRPPGVNSSLRHFAAILNKLDNHLLRNQERDTPMDIILTGDFNFPNDTVEWVSSDDGLLADRKQGRTNTNAAFDFLLDTMTQFNLEQMVGKNTRNTKDANGYVTGGSILDLVLTNVPNLFSLCTVISLNKISDHDLVHFEVKENSVNANRRCDTPHNKPDITNFNFKRANEVVFADALCNTDWDTFIGEIDSIDQANKNFARAIVNAAETANVQKFSTPTIKRDGMKNALYLKRKSPSMFTLTYNISDLPTK